MSESNALRSVVVNGPWAPRPLAPAVETTDAELVALLRSDLKRGAAAIHDRFAPVVHRLVWRLLGADVGHNDFVQQVFCKVLLHATQMRDAERLGAKVADFIVEAPAMSRIVDLLGSWQRSFAS